MNLLTYANSYCWTECPIDFDYSSLSYQGWVVHMYNHIFHALICSYGNHA